MSADASEGDVVCEFPAEQILAGRERGELLGVLAIDAAGPVVGMCVEMRLAIEGVVGKLCSEFGVGVFGFVRDPAVEHPCVGTALVGMGEKLFINIELHSRWG